MLTAVLLAFDILRAGLVSYYFNLGWLFLALFIAFLLAVKFSKEKALRKEFRRAEILFGALLFLLLLFKTLSLGWFSLVISAAFIMLFFVFWYSVRCFVKAPRGD